MSDRFYTQMAEHFRIPHYELNIALRDHDSPEYKKLEKKAEKSINKRAILPGFSLKDNYLLGNQYKDSYARKGMLNQEYIEKKTKELMEKFDVRAVNGDQLIGALSGGNQQKLVLSREVDKDPDLILACQPVRGLDIGAIKFIHNVLLELRNQGKAVLLISAELSDLFQLSDRIGVLYKGEMMSLQETEKYTTESISLLMAGKKGV